tara:strand:- start:422 stop:838 length:417 start_codon:yes stop_codon:yes gene_type:complete
MTYQLAQEHFTKSQYPINPGIYDWCLDVGNLTYLDHLSQHYLGATKELAIICSEYKYLLCNHQKMDLLLTKLIDLLNEAANGDWYSLKEVENKGASTLLGVLDILEDISLALEAKGKFNKYAKLEEELSSFYQRYFET